MFPQLAAPTPLDINFRLGRYPVRISPWFWLATVFLGFSGAAEPLHLALWVVTVLFSILIHELGHSVVGWAFGKPSHIVLHAMGGYASFDAGSPRRGWPDLLTCLGGVAVNLAFGALLYLSERSVDWTRHDELLWLAYQFLLFQNITWALVNLLPVYPLDGGQSLVNILHLLGVRRPVPPAHLTGVVVGGALALVGLSVLMRIDSPILQYLPLTPGPYMMVLFGFLAFQNWRMYQAHQATRDPWEEDSERWRG